MPDEFKQYAIAAVNAAARTDEPNNYPDVALTGFPDERAAVRAMNQWIAETVAKHNARPGNQSDPAKWYAEKAVTSTECWPTKGHIFAIQDGKRKDQVEFYIIDTLPHVKDGPLPDAEDYLNY